MYRNVTHKRAIQRLIVALGLLIVVMGGMVSCASFPQNQLPLAAALPTFSGQRPSVLFSIRFISDVIGEFEYASPPPSIRRTIEHVAKESGMFSAYTFEAYENTDYIVAVEIRNQGCLACVFFSALITGGSLYLIPSYVTDEFVMTTTIKIRNGPTQKHYEYRDSILTWQGIWFLPFIWKTPGDAARETLNNAVRTLFKDMADDQVFASASGQ